MSENEMLKNTLECADIPEINIVFEGNIENVNITVNHFREEDKEYEKENS